MRRIIVLLTIGFLLICGFKAFASAKTEFERIVESYEAYFDEFGE